MQSEINQTQKDKQYDSTLHEVLRRVIFIEKSTILVVTRGWRVGGRNGEVLFNGYRVLV